MLPAWMALWTSTSWTDCPGLGYEQLELQGTFCSANSPPSSHKRACRRAADDDKQCSAASGPNLKHTGAPKHPFGRSGKNASWIGQHRLLAEHHVLTLLPLLGELLLG